MKTLHINTIRKILKDNNFDMATSYSNGRVRGLTSSNGDISLTNHSTIDGITGIAITSRKGNLNKAIKLVKNNGFKIYNWTHPSGMSTRTIITL